MKGWQKFHVYNLAAVFSGAALTFAFAPHQVFPLAVLMPACLLTLWLGVSPKRAFWLGFLFGAGFFGAGVYWVYISIHNIGEVPSWLSVIITAGMVAELALSPGLVGYFLNRFFPINNTTKLLCAYPALWVLSEWVRSWLFTGFAWLFLGYSQTNSPLKGYAPILSVYGVSLALVLSAALLVNAIMKFRQQNYRALYFSLFALSIIWISGSLFNLIPWTKPHGNPLSVSLVQGNIPQEIKWTSENVELSFTRYEELTEPLWGKSKLIIWPETAIPMLLQDAAAFVEVMDQKAKKSGTQLILGIPMRGEEEGYYNAIVSLGKDEKVYTKRHLVPFGEYVPIYQYLQPLLKYMNIPTSNLTPGNISQSFMQLGDLKIQTSICYEITFPELININDKTIDFLLTVTNDAWFGRSAAQAQHLQMAAMRAIELRRPVIIVSNDGITAIIGPDGKVEAAAPPYQTYVLTSTVQPTEGLTPWMRNGMDPLLFLLITMLFLARIKYRNSLREARRALEINKNEI